MRPWFVILVFLILIREHHVEAFVVVVPSGCAPLFRLREATARVVGPGACRSSLCLSSVTGDSPSPRIGTTVSPTVSALAASLPASFTPSPRFFSAKSLSNIARDVSFPLRDFFLRVCRAASLDRPSKIQALVWSRLLGDIDAAASATNATSPAPYIIAEQTGSGKTLAYLIPSLVDMLMSRSASQPSPSPPALRPSSPSVLVLCPTSDLVSQVGAVSKRLAAKGGGLWRTAAVSASIGIKRNPFMESGHPVGGYRNDTDSSVRDQARMLRANDVDVLVGTPGRICQLLNAVPSCLTLSSVKTIVLDEIDVLMSADQTFTPQLNHIGKRLPLSCRFVCVTATLPDAIVEAIEGEFPSVRVNKVKGPGLHRPPTTLTTRLVDVSVPESLSRDEDACFSKKADALLDSLRRTRCDRTLVFCNTVESCRKVENLLARKDRRGELYDVGSYHSALSTDARNKACKHFEEERPDRNQVLVCSDRASRGLDFSGQHVGHVVIFDFPKDPAEYVRRIGRTARAGREGDVTVLAYGWQLPLARKLVAEAREGAEAASTKTSSTLLVGVEELTRRTEERGDKEALLALPQLIATSKLFVNSTLFADAEEA